MTLTLWDLIEPIRKKLRPERPEPASPAVVASPETDDKTKGARVQAAGGQRAPARRRRAAGNAAPIPLARPAGAAAARTVSAAEPSMQDRYDAVVRLMLDRYQVRVRKWRSGMSGVAWYVEYRDGRRQNLIESPRPKGPMSAAVFLHEIGHHAIGFNVYKPRCLEEYHAWRWALAAMEAHGLNITDQVRYRMAGSLHYAVQKARRRGIKSIPAELTPYLERPVRPGKRRRRG